MKGTMEVVWRNFLRTDRKPVRILEGAVKELETIWEETKIELAKVFLAVYN